MSNTRVQAAAEGMPAINRRRAIAISGAGLTAALVGLAVASVPAKASGVSPALVTLLRDFDQSIKDYLQANRDYNDIDAEPGGPFSPRYQVRGKAAAEMCIMDRPTLSSVAEAEAWFAEEIVKAERTRDQFSGMGALFRGHQGVVDARKRYRVEVIALLREQEAAYAPVEAARVASEEACYRAFDLLDEVLDMPCASHDDVQAKARYLISKDFEDLSADLEYPEVKRLLASFAFDVEAGGKAVQS